MLPLLIFCSLFFASAADQELNTTTLENSISSQALENYTSSILSISSTLSDVASSTAGGSEDTVKASPLVTILIVLGVALLLFVLLLVIFSCLIQDKISPQKTNVQPVVTVPSTSLNYKAQPSKSKKSFKSVVKVENEVKAPEKETLPIDKKPDNENKEKLNKKEKSNKSEELKNEEFVQKEEPVKQEKSQRSVKWDNKRAYSSIFSTHPLLALERHSNSPLTEEDHLPEWAADLVDENNEPLQAPFKYGQLNDALRLKIAKDNKMMKDLEKYRNWYEETRSIRGWIEKEKNRKKLASSKSSKESEEEEEEVKKDSEVKLPTNIYK